MKFSFIIPALNEEEYIGRCIDSIKKQGEGVFEIIVVDNGSTDKTTEIARKKGCKVIFEKEKGISPARNRGAREAKGNYLCFIDADGELKENWLKVAKETLQKRNEVAVSGLNIFVHESVVKRIWYNTFTLLAFTGIFLVKVLFDRAFLFNNMAIKKTKFLKTGGFENVLGEEIWFSIKYWKMGGKGAFNPKMVVYYSSRGFDEEGFIKTLLFWFVTMSLKKKPDNYSYKNKK